MKKTAETDTYWAQFRAYHSNAPQDYRLMQFGGGDLAMADELVGWVLHGPKRGTTWLLRDHHDGVEPYFPGPGDLFLLLDGRNAPRGVLQTVRVDTCCFRDVDAAFAWDEGEDDRSLESWRRIHLWYFGRLAAQRGFTFDETMMVVLERFRVAWPLDLADS